jgi:fucose 4-O-acetylase-like acetyltransferase
MKQVLPMGVSEQFKFWSFVSMVLLVFVHGYNLQQRYMQPFTVVEEPITATAYLEYLLANGFFRFRIPMLFAISGYLFALSDASATYGKRIGKRFRTLLLPYFIWSGIGLLVTYLFELFPYTKSLVAQSHLMQIDEHRSFLHQFKWYEGLLAWLISLHTYQLWFIRVLFIYNLAYPGINWLVTHKIASYIFFPIAIFLWLTHMGLFFIDGEGLLFFSLGVWMQKRNFNLVTPPIWLAIKWWLPVFIVTALVKTWLAFKGMQFINGNYCFGH